MKMERKGKSYHTTIVVMGRKYKHKGDEFHSWFHTRNTKADMLIQVIK